MNNIFIVLRQDEAEVIETRSYTLMTQLLETLSNKI